MTMSVLFSALDKLDEKQGPSTRPWSRPTAGGSSGFFADLPAEVLNDFYDLREYIRIANLRGMTRVISITSSVSGEGASTVATYLALLMAGAHEKAKAREEQPAPDATEQPAPEATAEEKLFEYEFRAFVQ